jgi:hypothetical protein
MFTCSSPGALEEDQRHTIQMSSEDKTDNMKHPHINIDSILGVGFSHPINNSPSTNYREYSGNIVELASSLPPRSTLNQCLIDIY